ncbi:MAG TPA: TasA family protein [Ilumatobacteraceae bacterium]|nr:TasA family protein [Ilumatobacteraceae bacterium]
MSRKLLLSSISIAATATLLGVGAFASYSDSERSETASVTAGTLNLEVDGSAVGEDYSVTNAYPGYKSGTGHGFVLKNTGTIDGNLRVFLVKDFDDENSLVEPETDVTDPGLGGEIDEYLAITVDGNSFGPFGLVPSLGLAGVGERVDITSWLWNVGEAPKLLAASAQYPASPYELWFGFEISDTADNTIMTDTLGFHLEFTLEQA